MSEIANYLRQIRRLQPNGKGLKLGRMRYRAQFRASKVAMMNELRQVGNRRRQFLPLQDMLRNRRWDLHA